MRKLAAVAWAVLLASTALAEEPVDLKWTLAKGDKFSLGISLEAASETRDEDGTWETTRTIKVSAVIEVLEPGDDGAKVEIRILRTMGKSRFKDGEIEDTPLDSEARDWKPIAATLTKGGELKIDLMTLMQNPEILIADCLMQLFPPLPEQPAKSKDTWPGLDTARAEMLTLAAVARRAGTIEATIEGTSRQEEEVPAAGGKKPGTRTTRGTSKTVFDATDGSLRSVTVNVTSELRVQGKGKPVQTQTFRRTAAVERLKAERK